MSDARKRARQADAARQEAAGPPPAATEADFVFPAEPLDPQPASPQAVRVSLPPSGLAEEVLPRLPEGQPSQPASAPAASAPVKIELPASGLAEDILGRQEARSVPAAPEPEAPKPAAEAAAAAAAGGAHSLFFATPAHEQRAAAEATEHLATFILDREEYGVDVRQVQEIRRVTEITSVPRAPEFVRGVINLRGRILPVLDLRRKLGLGEVAASGAARIIVVRVKERLLGLLVDGASQVLKVPLSRIEPAPEEVVERGGDYIRGVAKLDDRLIILVEIERLLAHELRASSSPAQSPRADGGSDEAS